MWKIARVLLLNGRPHCAVRPHAPDACSSCSQDSLTDFVVDTSKAKITQLVIWVLSKSCYRHN